MVDQLQKLSFVAGHDTLCFKSNCGARATEKLMIGEK